MSKQVLTLLMVFVSIIFQPAAYAEFVDGLYDVAIPVSSQSNKELSKATKQALKTVFIRVSGDANVATNRQIAIAINKATRFTRQFRYQQAERISGEEQLEVFIEFEQLLVDKALRESGLAMWSQNRPTILVWLVVEDADGRRFASPDRDADLLSAITDNAIRRGLSLKFPLLDLEDMVALSTQQLWQLNYWSLKPALERYKADTALLGRVSKLTNGEWLGRWLYSYDQQQLEFDTDANNAQDYSAVAIDWVAQLLAEKYAVAPVDIVEGGVLIRLTGVGSFIDYARAINYLESVTAIRHANVVDINGSDIILRLVADGSLSQLQQAFLLDRRLQSSIKPYAGEYKIVLDYNWPTIGDTAEVISEEDKSGSISSHVIN